MISEELAGVADGLMGRERRRAAGMPGRTAHAAYEAEPVVRWRAEIGVPVARWLAEIGGPAWIREQAAIPGRSS
jgi:hypothetical protein